MPVTSNPTFGGIGLYSPSYAGVLEEKEQVLSVNECFSDSNPYVNVFGGHSASTFAPFA
jgi:hypothetical protein